ncbi:lytic transglycosylase domain-containing protein [Rhodovulum sp.]|uniref:lytic transglycosylase domain-containing protein n=1 Tax=Rhodovulum sp. TaxID=34009 RepID=UPI001830B668|nr:lytic transglycosylase domain-containing protein [Rhodovulum sp.]HDR29622.1 lytic transglycosylase domain-containing protein [Rhodovulum sp.]
MRLTTLSLLIALAVPTVASAASPLARAMTEVRADRWEAAWAQAAPAGPVARDIVTWRWLRAGQGEFADYLDFTARNPDWPGLARLRAEGEAKIPADAHPDRVIAYFRGAAPTTGAGALRLVQAHAARGEIAEARALALRAWRTLPLSEGAQDELLSRFRDHLAEHHVARLDEMLWQGHFVSARRMLPLVPAGWKALAEARMALREDAPGVDALIARVPAALSNDPGLAHERFGWRQRKERTADAIALIEERSGSAAALGKPEEWAGARRAFVRQLLRDGDPARAYRMAARHHLGGGADFADLEWLAGFIALRYLNKPDAALGHFRTLEARVGSPISLARAGYWQGRALEALGRPQEAKAAYSRAGAHQTTYYGLLAAERAGLPMDPALVGNETYPDWRDAPWANGSVLRAALMFHEAGERALTEMFLTHLAETAGPRGQRQLAGLALRLGDHHVALRIAKVAAGQGNVMVAAYFPLTDLARAKHPVPTELVKAIARRESEFNPAAVSPAGARGLMQVMPGTAEAMAGRLGMRYSSKALTSDPAYNARLGAAYLAHLVEAFGLNPVLVAASYNAGPNRARAWVTEHGDPRSAGVDVVDWVELIPFRETRNYVMRVAESLPVYRARLSGRTEPIRLSQELKAR